MRDDLTDIRRELIKKLTLEYARIKDDMTYLSKEEIIERAPVLAIMREAVLHVHDTDMKKPELLALLRRKNALKLIAENWTSGYYSMYQDMGLCLIDTARDLIFENDRRKEAGIER